MRLPHLFLFIVFCSITSAWPHPDEISEAFPDLGSNFDIFSLPTAAELDFAPELELAQAGLAECLVDENPVELPGSDTTENKLFGSIGDPPLDTDLFRNLDIMTTTRAAPPCGPDGTHYRLCCFQVWGAPGFVSSCQSGTYIVRSFRGNIRRKCGGNP